MSKKNLALIDIFLIFIVLFFSFSIFGLQPLGGNNVIYIPLMEHLQNNNLFTEDLLIQTINYHPTLFFNIIVILSNFLHVSIKSILIVLPWLVSFSQALLIFLLSQLLFNNRVISYLNLIFLLSSKSSLAFEPIGINLGQVTPTTFSLPLALLVFYCYLKGNLVLAFLLLGFIANFQPLITIQLALILWFTQLLENHPQRSWQTLIKKIFHQTVSLLIGGLPLFLLKRNENFWFWFQTPQSWLDLIKIRTAHHFLPLTWSFTSWALLFLFTFLFVLSFRYRKKINDLNKLDIKISKLLISFYLLFIIAFFFSEVLPVRPVMILSLFRSFSFYNLFCLYYGSYYIFKLLGNVNVPKQLRGLFLASLLFLPSSFFYELNFYSSLAKGILLFFIISGGIILIAYILRLEKNKVNNLLLIGAIFFLLSSAVRRVYKNYQIWHTLTLDNSSDKEWRNVQLWAVKNSSVNSVFLTPPQLTGFRVFSQRTIIGEYKDGANFIYHPNLLVDWWGRMQDLGVEKGMAKGAFLFGYPEIRDEMIIKQLTEKYKADYLVSSYNDLNLPKVYNNNQFTIYKLD